MARIQGIAAIVFAASGTFIGASVSPDNGYNIQITSRPVEAVLAENSNFYSTIRIEIDRALECRSAIANYVSRNYPKAMIIDFKDNNASAPSGEVVQEQ